MIPTAGLDERLNSVDEIRTLAEMTGILPVSGDMFIALPGYCGNNIDLDSLFAVGVENKSRLVSMQSGLGHFKEWIYAKFDPKGDKKYRAYLISF